MIFGQRFLSPEILFYLMQFHISSFWERCLYIPEYFVSYNREKIFNMVFWGPQA